MRKLTRNIVISACLLALPLGLQASTINANNDAPEFILGYGSNTIKNVHTMDNMKTQDASLSVIPWASDYWAIANGGIAHRYSDSGALDANQYGYSYTYSYYVTTAPTYSLIKSNRIDMLSPAEKYDLLVGDSNFSLTKEALGEGRDHFSGGQVPGWAGICHGWALAAIVEDAPRKTVTLTDVTGKYKINFYPHDIRALISQYYSRVETAFHTVGTGIDCRKYDAEGQSGEQGGNLTRIDPASGKVLDPECDDTNPGSFHTILVNNVGIRKKSFVLDQTFDAEIWNQPVHKYSVRYYNPVTNQSTYSAKDAMVKIDQFGGDKRRNYRDPRTVYVVGVNAQVTYTIESTPDKAGVLSSQYDLNSSQTDAYRYDLELDAQGNILGGEWYSKAHPDFLYVQDKSVSILTHYDSLVHGNNIQEIVRSASSVAADASVANKAPLYKVIQKMNQLSK